MSKIFEEALADAKKLKEVAEENAKKAILESVTPKIKEFIENQILEQDNNEVNNGNIDDIDEYSGESLLEMLGAQHLVREIENKDKLKESYNIALSRLNEADQVKIKKLIKKINQQRNNLEQRNIINSVNTIQENNLMKSREKFYEVDLSLLREAVEDGATASGIKGVWRDDTPQM